MMNASAIHLGVRRYDRRDNGYLAPDLPAATLRSAEAFHRLAMQRGFESTLLLDEQVTFASLRDWVVKTVRRARTGATVMITFSGYGFNPYLVAPSDAHGWILYDRPLRFESLFLDLCAMRRGVRVAVISMSCFAGWPPPGAAGAMSKTGGASVVHLAACGGDELLSAHTTFAFDVVNACERRPPITFEELVAELPREGATPQVVRLGPRDAALRPFAITHPRGAAARSLRA